VIGWISVVSILRLGYSLVTCSNPKSIVGKVKHYGQGGVNHYE